MNNADDKARLTRRTFLSDSGRLGLAAAIGMAVPFGRLLPAGLAPVAYAADLPQIPGKEGLIGLGDRPLNAETPAHLLDDAVTPNRYMFIRNNGLPPGVAVTFWPVALQFADQPGPHDSPLGRAKVSVHPAQASPVFLTVRFAVKPLFQLLTV
jgi:hypothetical protein